MRFCLALITLLLLPLFASSQTPVATAPVTMVRGTVYDKTTGEPVFAAVVYLQGTVKSTLTDLNGFFSIKCDPGTFTLCVQALSYYADSTQVKIEGGKIITLNLFLQNIIPDSAARYPACGNINGLCFTKKGSIDSAHSSFRSLDSVVAMMNDRPKKKICIVAGYRYEDGSFEPLDNNEIFIRKYLTSKGVSTDRIVFCNTPSGPAKPINIIRIEDIPVKTHKRHHLFHKTGSKRSRKGKGKPEACWVDATTAPDVRINAH